MCLQSHVFVFTWNSSETYSILIFYDRRCIIHYIWQRFIALSSEESSWKGWTYRCVCFSIAVHFCGLVHLFNGKKMHIIKL
ncbi:hypothetical protein XELAEV_18031675mg [Xenopus laevis]|uniref:Uncharacterized protein n=1 Tax=Xenopus laevis TaxID=8355 RepID=A0A974HFY6_XENLA|nr:hypothetical protein XELAEV_18031675mg [Xenopus laevis]